MLFKVRLQIQISSVKVAFISRDTLYKDPGGDTVQIENTVRSLRELGVEVDVLLASTKIDYSRYDLLHFFNIITFPYISPS